MTYTRRTQNIVLQHNSLPRVESSSILIIKQSKKRKRSHKSLNHTTPVTPRNNIPLPALQIIQKNSSLSGGVGSNPTAATNVVTPFSLPAPSPVPSPHLYKGTTITTFRRLMASNQGHLRVVIFVLLRGVIFGVLGQAQGNHLQKNCRKWLLFDPLV